jgi:hypothetical protein
VSTKMSIRLMKPASGPTPVMSSAASNREVLRLDWDAVRDPRRQRLYVRWP